MTFLRWPTLAAVALLAVAPATAESRLVGTYDFSLEAGVLAIDSKKNDTSRPSLSLTLLTGTNDLEGRRAGLFAFLGIRNLSVTDATRLEVINTQDEAAAFDRARLGQCTSAITCSVERTFHHGRAFADPRGSALLFYDGVEASYNLHAAFALSSVVRLPGDLAGKALKNLQIEQSLLAVSDTVAASGNSSSDTGNVYLKLTNNESAITIVGDEGSATYNGTRYLFHFVGRTGFSGAAEGVVVPFKANATLRMAPTDGTDLKAHFRPETINGVFRTMDPNATVLSDDVAKNLQPLAPILNGVIFGNTSNAVANGQPLGNSSLTLVRFSSLSVRPAFAGGASAAGTGSFLLIGDGFYTTKTAIDLGPIQLPYLSLVLWLLAAGAIVGAFFLKPLLGLPTIGGFGTVRVVGWLFHGLALVLAFILWDREVHDFLGASILDLFGSGAAGSGAAFAVIFAFEMLPWTVAHFTFGMPMRFIVNSGLKIGGLQRARGIGKGIGNLATWGLGAAFIPLYMNGFIGLLLDVAGKALPR